MLDTYARGLYRPAIDRLATQAARPGVCARPR